MPKKLPKKSFKFDPKKVDLEAFRNKLKLKSLQEKLKFDNKFPHAKVAAAGVLASALVLGTASAHNIASPAPGAVADVSAESTHGALVKDLKSVLPAKTQPLTADQEKKISSMFKNILGVNAVGTLEGEHLNTTYGLIGAEQHLRRYPGDTISQHDDSDEPYDEGMAPGLGAWGYFAPSKEKMTAADVQNEKWYAVVQTLYLPDWNKRLAYLRDWYKYRKVLIVNTQNGNAVVADIADSGPAAWTGKVFGGSPAVMNSLGGAKYKVGAVVLFFVDDPNNKVPLGPVGYNVVTASNLAQVIQK